MKYIFGETLLMKASQINNLKILKFLLNQGVKLEEKDDLGKTALYCACYEENIEAVKLLLSKGSNFNVKIGPKLSLIEALIYG